MEECLKVTLHCVGVCVLSKEMGPCMIMMQTIHPCGLYCVSLTQESAEYVSPLYEHTLLLKKLPLPADLAEDGNALLASFTGQAVYVVESRTTCHARIDAQYDQSGLSKKLTQLLGCSLFLDIDCSYSGLPEKDDGRRLLTPLFTSHKETSLEYAYWHCADPVDCALLKKYLDLYVDVAGQRYSGRGKKTLYDRYWDAVALQKQTVSLSAAVELLMKFVPNNQLFSRAYVVNLFGKWTQYKAIASYFRHRVASIPQTCVLYKTVPPHSPLFKKIVLLSCADRITLHDFLKGPARKGLLSTSTKELSDSFLLFSRPLRGLFYEVLRCAAGGKEDNVEELKYLLLTHYVMSRLEENANSTSAENKSTLGAVSLASVYFAYHSFTQTEKFQALDPAWSIDLKPSKEANEMGAESEEETVEIDPWLPSWTDFGQFVVYMHRHIEKGLSPSWLLKEQKTSVVTGKAGVFFIILNPELLKIEEDNAALYQEHLHGKALLHLQVHHTQPIHPLNWQQEWLQLKATRPEGQQYQFLLFTPLEIMRNEDLGSLLAMFMADVHNTTILREASDIFFLRRLSHYVGYNQQEMTPVEFHRNHCYSSREFHAISIDAIKETVIVPQCHTFSVHAMNQLMLWCLYHSETVKRIIFMGSPFIFPCMAHGSPFLDLLRLAVPTEIRPQLYRNDARAEEFSAVIKKYWRAPKNTSPEQEQFLKEGGCRVLFAVKNEDAFIQALGTGGGANQPRRIYCLTGKSDIESPYVKSLDDCMSAKEKARFKPVTRSVDKLCIYNCLPAQTASDVFVISRTVLFALSKNDLLYLFMLLEKLYVFDTPGKKGDLLEALCTEYASRNKPNQRYTYMSIGK